MAVKEINHSETEGLICSAVQLGLIPVGKEEQHRIHPNKDTIKAVNYIIDHCEPDKTIRSSGNSSLVFSMHKTEDYSVASSLRPSRESKVFYRASSIIVPVIGRTCFEGFFGETHLYIPSNPNEINPDHIITLEERRVIPFQIYGRQLLEAA